MTAEATRDDILSLALSYAGKGWALFPVSGKHPVEISAGRRMRWSQHSTSDPEQIVAWYAGTSGLGIGIDMGKSGLVALDADKYDEFIEWVGDSSQLNGAMMQQGNPARATFIFAQPVPPIRCPVLPWGEVKGVGGYIVAAGSPHPEHGVYVWLNTPDTTSALPESLAVRLRTSKGKTHTGSEKVPEAWRTPDDPCKRAAKIVEDAIDAMATAAQPAMLPASMTLLRLGEQGHRGIGEALDLLGDAYIQTVSRPRSDKTHRPVTIAREELRRAYEGAVPTIQGTPSDPSDPFSAFDPCHGDTCGDPQQQPMPVSSATMLDSIRAQAPAPWTPPPIHVLPATLRDVVEAVADHTETDPTLGLLVALAAVSAAAGNGLSVAVRSGWTEPLSLWTASGADPSERKSSVLSLIGTKPVAEAQALVTARIDNKAQATESVAAVAALEQAQRNLRQAKTDPDRDSYSRDFVAAQHRVSQAEVALNESRAPNYLITEATPEALLDVMEDNRGVAAAFTAEGALIETITGGYGDKPSPVMTTINSAWSGELIRSVRRGSRSVVIPNPHLTIGMCVQPSVLHRLAGQRLVESGFTSRWLLAIPPKRAGRRENHGRPLNRAAVDTWTQLLTAVMGRGWSRQDTITLNPEAETILGQWRAMAEQSIADASIDTDGWWGKSTGQLLRLAALLALVDDPNVRAVSGPVMRAAYELTEWIEHVTTELLGGRLSLHGDLSDKGQQEGHQHVLAWAKARTASDGWWEIRDFQRSQIKASRSGWWSVADMKPSAVVAQVVAELVDLGELDSRARPSAKDGVPIVGQFRVRLAADKPPILSDQHELVGQPYEASRLVGLVATNTQESNLSIYPPLTEDQEETPSAPGVFKEVSDQPTSKPAACRVCSKPLDPFLTSSGYETHPNCQTVPDVFGDHW